MFVNEPWTWGTNPNWASNFKLRDQAKLELLLILAWQTLSEFKLQYFLFELNSNWECLGLTRFISTSVKKRKRKVYK